MKTHHSDDINPSVKPSGTGCVECLATGGWWFHLRRRAECGHIGCCDSSPNRHATAHHHQTGHPVIASFEPGEEWFYSFLRREYVGGSALAEPRYRAGRAADSGAAWKSAQRLAIETSVTKSPFQRQRILDALEVERYLIY